MQPSLLRHVLAILVASALLLGAFFFTLGALRSNDPLGTGVESDAMIGIGALVVMGLASNPVLFVIRALFLRPRPLPAPPQQPVDADVTPNPPSQP